MATVMPVGATPGKRSGKPKETAALTITPERYRVLCQMAEMEIGKFRAQMEKEGFVQYPSHLAHGEEIPGELAEMQKAAAVNVVSVVLNLIGVSHLADA